MADEIFDKTKLGIAKGRPGGYAAVFPVGTSIAALSDMTKTIKDLLEDDKLGGDSLGYIDENGVEFETSTDTEDKADWGGNVVATSVSSYSETATATFIESRASVLKANYGDDNVTVDGATTKVMHNKNFTAPHVYLFDAVVSETLVKRSIIPIGCIYERDTVTQNSSDLMGYKPTIKCSPFDADGNTYTELFYDTAKAAALAEAEAAEAEGASDDGEGY